MLRRRAALLVFAALVVLAGAPGAASAAARVSVPPPNSEPYVAPIDQPMSLNECWVDTKHGYAVKNIYSACWFTDMHFTHYACPDPSCAVDGSAAAYEFTTVNAVKDARQVAVSHRFVNWRVSTLPESTRLGVTIDCVAGVAGGGGVCDQSSVTVVRSIAEWRANSDVTVVFSLSGEDVPAAGVLPEVQAEKRASYSVRSRFVADTADRYTISSNVTGPGVRCDVARSVDGDYVRGSDCVLRTWYTPMFDFKVEDATSEAAQFVTDFAPAGYLPGYPGYQGRSEGFTGPQNRLFYDVVARQSHRMVAEQKCAQGWGANWAQRADGGVNACAAYPFDESVQGASSVPSTTGRPRFEVQPVRAGDQAEFQRRFTRFLAENHVLDGDQYYVYPA